MKRVVADRLGAAQGQDRAPCRVDGAASWSDGAGAWLLNGAVRHAWKPSGKAPFLAIQVLAPPGPEQRFKTLAGKTL